MNTSVDTDLRKVTASTTLCHLCSVEQLEKWAKEARRQCKIQKEKTDEEDNKSRDHNA